MTTATLPPNRTTFREAVAEVAAKAKAILPVDVNGRIESAVKLVLAQDVPPPRTMGSTSCERAPMR